MVCSDVSVTRVEVAPVVSNVVETPVVPVVAGKEVVTSEVWPVDMKGDEVAGVPVVCVETGEELVSCWVVVSIVEGEPEVSVLTGVELVPSEVAGAEVLA